MHGTVPRAHEAWESELLVWLASDYQARHHAGAAFPDTWTRLTPPAPCPRAAAVTSSTREAPTPARCMVETDAGPDGFVLEARCGYRPDTGDLALD